MANTAARAACQSTPNLDISPRSTAPPLAVDDHGSFDAAGPFHEIGGTTGALHGRVALVLHTIAVRSAGAHQASGVHDAAIPMRTRNVRWISTGQIPLGQHRSSQALHGKCVPGR